MALGNIHLTPQLVQAVRDTADIVDIANEMTRLKRAGKRWQGLCPFHKEKTPSFSVDPGPGLFYCFGCGAGGDAIKLYMQHSGDDFPAAIEALARRYGIPLPAAPAPGRGGPASRRDLTKPLEAAAQLFVAELRASELARRYLAERRLPDELVESYGLGYAPAGKRLLEALGDKFPADDLVAAGLLGRGDRGDLYDRFRHRLMFPIHNPSGRLVGFGGRTLGDDRAKYVNTAETEYFHKGNLLYGFHQAKKVLRDSGRAILVEGYFDVLGTEACGAEGAVAGMGTALTTDQARLLARYVDLVVVAYDGDEAGEKAFLRALPILLAAGLQVRRARFPAGHDPDSLRLAAGPEAVLRLLDDAEDAVESEIRRLLPRDPRDPAERSRVAATVGELLRPIPDTIVRYTYGQRAAERLGVPLEMLLQRLGKVAPPEPAAGAERAPRETLSLEERAIALLLGGEERLPAERLPPEEIFFDDDCRNIYSTFCALYRDGDRVPGVDRVVARLGSEGRAIDRVARLLLEESAPGGEGDLPATLERLLRRWRKQRQSELLQRIRQAQEDGDHDRLRRLLDEKSTLNRTLHPEMTGKWW